MYFILDNSRKKLYFACRYPPVYGDLLLCPFKCGDVLVCPFKLSSGELVTGGLLNIETELRDKIYLLGEQSANSKDFTDHALISFIKLANKPILNGVVEIVWNRVVLHGISNIVQRSNTLLNVNQSRDFNF